MEIVNITLYFIFAYGLSNLLVYGSGPLNVLGRFRQLSEKFLPTLGDMLKCMMCTSANIGWITSLLNVVCLPSVPITPFNLVINDPSLWYVIVFCDLCATSGAVWLIHTLQETLERTGNYE